MKTPKTIILYHKGCSDGFGAAFAAWKKFGNKAEYIPVKYDEEPPKGLKGKDIYMLDFCYQEKTTEKILKTANSFMIIDHHFSRKKIIKSLPNHIYAENHSGAILSWKYFQPNKKIPKLLEYIEDIDLWTRKMPNTSELCASLWSYEKDFKIWNKIARDWETTKGRKKYVDEGRAMLKTHDQIVEQAVRHAQTAKFFGHKVLVSNSHILTSEIAHALIDKMPPIAIVWYQKGNKIKVRLNS